MNHICHKVYLQPLFYFFTLAVVLTGHFHDFMNIMIIVLFHELGHLLGAFIFKWKVKRLIIFPLGCMTEFNERLNRPIYQEFIILILGPLFQIFLYQFYPTDFHYPLLWFNLLPIYPLDGSKFVFLFWNIIGSYYNSYIVTFVISYITVFCLIIHYHNLLILLFSIWLLISSIKMFDNRKIHFWTFLYERLHYKYFFYRKKIILGDNIFKMKRDVCHYFFIKRFLYNEQIFLKKKLNLTKM